MDNISVMYHNVLGYNVTQSDVESRAATLLTLYQNQAPDILGFQEFTNDFRSFIDGTDFEAWLYDNYIEICYGDGGSALEDQGGIATPIFYRKDAGLTLGSSGYVRARTAATKGTTWATFTTGEGNTFCVSNSHFVSPTEQGANTEYVKMREYREADVSAWLTKLSSLNLDCPVISGGDFNSGKTYAEPNAENYSTPYEMLANAGCTAAGTVEGSLSEGIVSGFDHVMLKGELLEYSYSFVSGDVSVVGSDHAPQNVTVIFK